MWIASTPRPPGVTSMLLISTYNWLIIINALEEISYGVSTNIYWKKLILHGLMFFCEFTYCEIAYFLCEQLLLILVSEQCGSSLYLWELFHVSNFDLEYLIVNFSGCTVFTSMSVWELMWTIMLTKRTFVKELCSADMKECYDTDNSTILE